MDKQIKALVSNIKIDGDQERIRAVIESFAQDEIVIENLKRQDLKKGLELYRDEKEGFILFAYEESQETYRVPHNHGNGWVIYSVVSGIVEMGLFKRVDQNLMVELINKELLKAGDSRVYNPKDIHDTRTLSKKSIIIRLTSCDLKKEVEEGRMLKFHL